MFLKSPALEEGFYPGVYVNVLSKLTEMGFCSLGPPVLPDCLSLRGMCFRLGLSAGMPALATGRD